MNTKTNLILISLLFLSSCYFKENNTEYDLLIAKEIHSFKVTEEKGQKFEISSSFVRGEPMTLKEIPENQTIMFGEKDIKQNNWRFAENSGKIREIHLTPYYSYYAYGWLQRLLDTKMEVLNPRCPVTTKYLFLAFMENGVPIAGCVHPKIN